MHFFVIHFRKQIYCIYIDIIYVELIYRRVETSCCSFWTCKFKSIQLHYTVFNNFRRSLQKLLVHPILLPLWCSGPTFKGKQSLRHIQKETRWKIQLRLSSWTERLLVFQLLHPTFAFFAFVLCDRKTNWLKFNFCFWLLWWPFSLTFWAQIMKWSHQTIFSHDATRSLCT